jgi:hypothetical protein
MKEVYDLLPRLFINPKLVDFTTAFSVRYKRIIVFMAVLTLLMYSKWIKMRMV